MSEIDLRGNNYCVMMWRGEKKGQTREHNESRIIRHQRANVHARAKKSLAVSSSYYECRGRVKDRRRKPKVAVIVREDRTADNIESCKNHDYFILFTFIIIIYALFTVADLPYS